MEKKDLRIVYMGTPDFAVESLKRLVEGGYNVVGVITLSLIHISLKCLPSSDRPGLSCPRGWVILKSVRDVRMIRHQDLLLLIHWMRLPILFWFSSMRKRISSRYWDSWRGFIKWNWMELHLWSGSWSMTVTSFPRFLNYVEGKSFRSFPGSILKERTNGSILLGGSP